MTAHRLRRLALASLVAAGLTVCLPSARPAAADPAADRLEELLSRPGESSGKSGPRLTWQEIRSDPASGDITVSGLRSAGAKGRGSVSAHSLTLSRPRVTGKGRLAAETLVLDGVETRAGPGDVARFDRLTVHQPDLAAVLELIAGGLSGGNGLDDREAWSRLVAGGLEIRGFEGKSADGEKPFELRFGRLFASGLDSDRLQRLEVDDAIAASTEEGDLVTLAVARIRASDIEIGETWDTLASHPDEFLPLSALADLRIGSIEVEGFNTQSALAGSTRIARQWVRTRSHRPGRSGTIEYGAEGVETSQDQVDNPVAPFLRSLFPPDGTVPVNWTGDLAYDVEEGFLGWRTRMAVERFGTLDFRIDLDGVPDLTAAEWEDVREGDPRVESVLIRSLSLSVTDEGGGDRTVMAMSDDATLKPADLRAAFAVQVGALAQMLGPETDPRLSAWARAVADFVRGGGTLSIGVTRPIPVGRATEEAGSGEDFTEIADRYGLVVTRR